MRNASTCFGLLDILKNSNVAIRLVFATVDAGWLNKVVDVLKHPLN